MSSIYTAVGKNIRAARDAKEMSREALAEAIDCSPSTISSIELGVNWPSKKTLNAIAAQLGVDIDAFFNIERPAISVIEKDHDLAECCARVTAAALAVKKPKSLLADKDEEVFALARKIIEYGDDRLKNAAFAGIREAARIMDRESTISDGAKIRKRGA